MSYTSYFPLCQNEPLNIYNLAKCINNTEKYKFNR